MITSLIVFNVGQQLTPEKLAAAIALWKERGPTSYDMEYTKPMVNETFKVRVRKGDVVSVTMNDQPLPEREYPYHSMRALFGFIERFQQIDQEPGQPRAFVRATFDETDGHIRRYVRSVSGKKERAEFVVTKLEPKD
jgi:hypothetical protein